MQFFYGDRFLFIDMHTPYQYAAMQGDRLIACTVDLPAADELCRTLRAEQIEIIRRLERALQVDIYSSAPHDYKLIADVRSRYRTDNDIRQTIVRQKDVLCNIRSVKLTVKN